jgi:hypothetical protein
MEKDYNTTQTKKVVVDGETYTKEIPITKHYSAEESFSNKDKDKNSHWIKKEFDEFIQFGLPTYYIWDDTNWGSYGGGRSGMLSRLSFHTSDSNYVCEISALHELNIIDNSIIKEIHWGRGSWTHIDNEFITFSPIHYGSGNYINIKIPIDKFLDMDFTLFGHYVKYQLQTYIRWGCLPAYILNKRKLTDDEKRKITNQIFNYIKRKY